LSGWFENAIALLGKLQGWRSHFWVVLECDRVLVLEGLFESAIAFVGMAIAYPSIYNPPLIPKSMSIIISDEVLQTTQMSEAELLTEIAIMLFQKEKFTLGQASRFAKINQLQFQRLLASRQIPLHYDIAELREDVKSLEANNWR
jgi:predicted HTH domain antitoxin